MRRQVLERMERSGLQDWFASRTDYGETLDAFCARARQSVHIVAVTLKLRASNGGLIPVLAKALSSSPMFKARISLLNPSAGVLSSLASGASQIDRLQREVEATLRELKELRSDMLLPAERFDIRTHRVLPFASAFVLDAFDPTGCIHLETRHFGDSCFDSFGFRIGAGCEFFERSRESWLRIIEEASPL